jgi:hypothetical protein
MEVFRLFTASTSISENRKKKKRKKSIDQRPLSLSKAAKLEGKHACLYICVRLRNTSMAWNGLDWTSEG